ncbi:hypothetical protein A5893_13875 [Pedobacter psychrophilus]|uniref:Uncharacterized protein n=1 Tax=Pedobacter psychrophilus TaxID=1826909 RepID=A0A179DDB2_9SPHI|nr:hypothetical protein [Pedobacter psychrophilus]OAQ38509.1 hypothetical protein A5893_13875 [Pedobacter psychrophilus]
MNSFYKQSKIRQWIEATLLLLLGFWPAMVIIEKGYSHPLFYLLLLIYVPVAQFAFTPFFKLTGVYNYYSPMLLGYMANHLQIDLHSGTSFDYLFVMRKYKPGFEIRNRLLMYYLEGLINLIQQIENKNIPEDVKIVGTSYFFKEKTLTKMGFEITKSSLFYRINLLVNFIDLIWMNSVSQGKLSIPAIWNAKTISITGIKLIENKKEVEEFYEMLKTKTSLN